jgi:uncharacterized protein YdhG (YjbR/CyaY superfamily)
MSPTKQTSPGRSPEVEAYLATASDAARDRLREVVALIRAELPDATERIAYAIPTWHQVENLIHVAGYERHVGLYPGAAALLAFARDLEGYVTSKGAVQFPHDRPLPLDLVRRVVRWRLDQVREKGASPPPRRRTTSPTPRTPDNLVRTDPGPISFEAVLHRSDASGAACFVDFPHDLKATYGRGNLVPVVATWDGQVEYRGSLAMMGGAAAMLLCRKDILAQLGKGPGEVVQVTVALDTSPREVEMPADLAVALDATDGGRAAWDALSPSARRDHATWVAGAKRTATRTSRVARSVELVLARKRPRG